MKERYPISFKDGTCGCCGASKSVELINRFDRKQDHPDIYPIYRMRCKSCKREFFIRWEDIDDQSSTAVPYASSYTIIDDFVDILDKANEENKKELYDKYEITDIGTF